jgi:hypothetical protein
LKAYNKLIQERLFSNNEEIDSINEDKKPTNLKDSLDITKNPAGNRYLFFIYNNPYSKRLSNNVIDQTLYCN